MPSVPGGARVRPGRLRQHSDAIPTGQPSFAGIYPPSAREDAEHTAQLTSFALNPSA